MRFNAVVNEKDESIRTTQRQAVQPGDLTEPKDPWLSVPASQQVRLFTVVADLKKNHDDVSLSTSILWQMEVISAFVHIMIVSHHAVKSKSIVGMDPSKGRNRRQVFVDSNGIVL